MERLTEHKNGKENVKCDIKECQYYDRNVGSKYWSAGACDGQCMENCIKKLCEYEDLEEQGLLIKLPCKVGDEVYRINQYAKEPVIPMRVLQVVFKATHSGYSSIRIDAIHKDDLGESSYFQREFGKAVFLTRTEAEEALAKMEGVDRDD